MCINLLVVSKILKVRVKDQRKSIFLEFYCLALYIDTCIFQWSFLNWHVNSKQPDDRICYLSGKYVLSTYFENTFELHRAFDMLRMHTRMLH